MTNSTHCHAWWPGGAQYLCSRRAAAEQQGYSAAWRLPTSHVFFIQGGVKVGTGSDFWNLYEEDIQRAADLGSNAFRLSVEWGRIEPVKGQIDVESVARYHAILDCWHGWAVTCSVSVRGLAKGFRAC